MLLHAPNVAYVHVKRMQVVTYCSFFTAEHDEEVHNITTVLWVLCRSQVGTSLLDT